MNWTDIFVPHTSFLEIFLRGTITYLALFFMLRLVLKREAGAVGVTDLLVLVLIADAAQNAMAGNYTSITDGLFLVATIIFWSYSLDWLSYHSPRFSSWLRPPPLLLVKDGVMQRRNMRRELVTVDELQSELREAGIEDIADVKKMYMEGNGKFSIITYSQPEQPTKKKGNKENNAF